jgi:membrane-associated protein
MDILSWLLSYILLYKYVALFIAEYAGAIILPIPVNAALLAIGAFSSQGYFNFWLSLIVAVTGNTLGDITDYALARKYDKKVIRWFRLDKVRFFTHLREELRTDAAITVFTTRFAGSLSSITNFLAGLAVVPFKTFFFYDLLGNIIEPLVGLSLGYAVGDYWNNFSGFFGLVSGIVAVSIIIFILVRMYRRITKKYLFS